MSFDRPAPATGRDQTTMNMPGAAGGDAAAHTAEGSRSTGGQSLATSARPAPDRAGSDAAVVASGTGAWAGAVAGRMAPGGVGPAAHRRRHRVKVFAGVVAIARSSRRRLRWPPSASAVRTTRLRHAAPYRRQPLRSPG
jgi:hypothetical protein